MDTRTRTTRSQLPPLILHPFTDAGGPAKLLRSSRANLTLQGILPSADETDAELERVLLEGRYCEVRMLCYVGKDVDRWIEQCLDLVKRDEQLTQLRLEYASFAHLLIEQTPLPVREKLHRWGVLDYPSIFRRGLGLNALFVDMPQQDSFHPDFLRNYHHYADGLYQTRSTRTLFPAADPELFDFQLFASGEYTRLLERSWQE